MKTYKNITVIVIAITMAFTSCKKDEIPPVPELPPVSSFAMEFDGFPQNKSAILTSKNWTYSVLNTSFFSTIVYANMFIPTIAFNESFTHEPTYIGEQTWQWSYEFIGLNATYTAKLNGVTERKDKVRWEMFVDKTGTNGFAGFLWFEGTTTDSTAANWTVYENHLSPSVLFDIEWESDASHSESVLKYTYRNTGSENANSTIEFGNNPGNTFDRYYNIFLTSDNSAITIEWNNTAKNGRVKSTNFFKDESWHCWNEKLDDDWCD
jgi:hypothetical protein